MDCVVHGAVWVLYCVPSKMGPEKSSKSPGFPSHLLHFGNVFKSTNFDSILDKHSLETQRRDLGGRTLAQKQWY